MGTWNPEDVDPTVSPEWARECAALRARAETAEALASGWKARAKEATSQRDAFSNGQEALRQQTVRIRHALTSDVEDGVDTEAIARRVRHERDNAYAAHERGLREYQKVLKKIVELEGDDYWKARARNALQNGMCPICFAVGGKAHTEECEWGQDTRRIEKLKAEIEQLRGGL